MAELDIDTLKTSTTRSEDFKKALESCKEKHGFLFGSNEPINNPNVGPTPGGSGSGNSTLDTFKKIMGIKEDAQK